MPTPQAIQDQINALIDPRVAEYEKNWRTAGKNTPQESSYKQSYDVYKQMQDQLRGAYGSSTLGAQDVNALSQIINKTAPQSVDVQGLNQYLLGVGQNQQAQQQLSDYRNQYLTQAFGSPTATMSQALTPGGQGDLSQLNSFLGGQEARTFNEQLKPLIQMSLGAQGLSDSGAQVELQSKALGQLEQAREQSLMQQALGYRDQAMGMQRSDILGNISGQQGNLANLANQQNAAITMQFQRDLEEKRAQLAYQLSQHRGGNGMFGSMLGMGLGAVAGGVLGGPAGAMIGGSLGGQLGGALGSQGGGQNPMQGFNSALMGMSGSMPSSFFTPSQPSQLQANPGTITGGGYNKGFGQYPGYYGYNGSMRVG